MGRGFLFSCVLVGAVVIVSGIAATVIFCRKKESEQNRHSDNQRTNNNEANTGLGRQARSDKQILENLPAEMKARIISSDGGMPAMITSAWLRHSIGGLICGGDEEEIQLFLMAIIKASCGAFVPAAEVGEVPDSKRMEPGREIGAGCRVSRIRYCGLIRVSTGDVLMKAVVE